MTMGVMMHLTEDAKAWLTKHYCRTSVEVVAAMLDCEPQDVQREAREIGVTQRELESVLSSSGRPYTSDDLNFVVNNAKEKGVAWVAWKLARTEEAIRICAKRLGVSLRTTPHYTAEDDDFLRANYGEMKNAHLGMILERTAESVRARAKLLKLTGRRKGDWQLLTKAHLFST